MRDLINGIKAMAAFSVGWGEERIVLQCQWPEHTQRWAKQARRHHFLMCSAWCYDFLQTASANTHTSWALHTHGERDAEADDRSDARGGGRRV